MTEKANGKAKHGHKSMESSLEDAKNAVMPKLDDVNRKVSDMRSSIQNDPENLTDKLIKFGLPALAGLVLTQVLQMAWKKGTKNDTVPSGSDTSTSLLGAMAFASISGALAAVISRLSTKGSNKLVDHRITKRETK